MTPNSSVTQIAGNIFAFLLLRTSLTLLLILFLLCYNLPFCSAPEDRTFLLLPSPPPLCQKLLSGFLNPESSWACQVWMEASYDIINAVIFWRALSLPGKALETPPGLIARGWSPTMTSVINNTIHMMRKSWTLRQYVWLGQKPLLAWAEATLPHTAKVGSPNYADFPLQSSLEDARDWDLDRWYFSNLFVYLTCF